MRAHEAPMNVLVVHEAKNGPSATQMISFGEPFKAQSGVCIEFEGHHDELSAIGASFAARKPELLVLSRYTAERGLDWISLAKAARIPVIFHIDDDLLAVPPSLGEAKFKAYNKPERLSALRNNIEGSDLLYVSTSELGRRFQEHKLRTPIAVGDIYCSIAREDVGELLPPASGPVVGYMGTAGHSADLAMVLPAICHVMERIPTLQFEVFGTVQMPGELGRFGRRVRHLPPVAEYRSFIARLRSLGWWIGLAPLEDNAFNRCKADTKWVEYSAAGMAVIASDLPVYHAACSGGAGLLAGPSAEWVDALHELVLRPDRRAQLVERAQVKLRESYTHDCLRAQVMRIFDQAFARLEEPASGQPAE
jgi:hypothetical protein